MIVHERRASTVLFHLLRSRADPRPLLLPANVCPVVPATLGRARQPFRFVDIDGADLGIDAGSVRQAVRASAGGIGGVVNVWPYGAEVERATLFAELRRMQPDLLLVDDRCLAVPDFDGASSWPDADLTLYSTGPSKQAGLAFGGFAHVREGVPYSRAPGRYSAVAARAMEREVSEATAEGRLPRGARSAWLPLARPKTGWAAFRRRAEAAWRTAAAHKERLNAIYSRRIPPESALPPAYQGWRYNLLVPEPARLVAGLFAAGLFASRHYPPLVRDAEAPVAAELHSRVVNLFNDAAFDEARALRAAEIVARHLAALA